MCDCLERLLDKKVTRLLLNDIKNSIVFEIENGTAERFNCEGECCSNSWIEHISGVHSLLNHTIKKIEYFDIDQEESDEYVDDNYERTLIYRWDIHTEAGICTMEMRNFSNGYYCGELTHISDSKEDDEDFEVPTIECKEDF